MVRSAISPQAPDFAADNDSYIELQQLRIFLLCILPVHAAVLTNGYLGWKVLHLFAEYHEDIPYHSIGMLPIKPCSFRRYLSIFYYLLIFMIKLSTYVTQVVTLGLIHSVETNVKAAGKAVLERTAAAGAAAPPPRGRVHNTVHFSLCFVEHGPFAPKAYKSNNL